MPTVAELLDREASGKLAALRANAEQHQAEAEATPVTASVCESCGQRLPVPAAVFSSGAEHHAPRDGAGADADPSRARA